MDEEQEEYGCTMFVKDSRKHTIYIPECSHAYTFLFSFSKLECSGEEKNIIDCQGPRWGVIGRSCIYHSKDAGVVCRPRSS